MGERGTPPHARIAAFDRYRVARADQPGEPSSARMIRQVDDQVIAALAQRLPKAQLSAQRKQAASLLQLAIDGMHHADRRVAIEHGCSLVIDERVHVDMWG